VSQYKIFLNLKKSVFGLLEGKILKNNFTKYGVNFDLKRIKGVK